MYYTPTDRNKTNDNNNYTYTVSKDDGFSVNFFEEGESDVVEATERLDDRFARSILARL